MPYSKRKIKKNISKPKQVSLPILIWFQLLDSTTGESYKQTGPLSVSLPPDDSFLVAEFLVAVKAKYADPYLAGIAPSDLCVFKNRAAYVADYAPLEDDYCLTGPNLGPSKINALIVIVPQPRPIVQPLPTFGDQQLQSTSQRSVAPNRIGTNISLNFSDGIDPMSRDDLLTKMFDLITSNERDKRFLLLNSPPASGKTSLLISFQDKYPQLNAIYVSLILNKNPWDTLLTFGLDKEKQTCRYDQVIYMLDDAQYRYDSSPFWDMLLTKVDPLYFGENVRFIISTSHVISTPDQLSPKQFRTLATINSDDLLLSDEQSMVLLSSPPPLGLPTSMQNFSLLKNTIIEHCNGLVGALRRSVLVYTRQTCHHQPTEVEALRLYYSQDLIDNMDFCFGIVHPLTVSVEAKDVLLKCVLGKCIPYVGNWYHRLFSDLTLFSKIGILINDKQNYNFSSILAKRYFVHRFFTNRADSDPPTLQELIIKAVESMKAEALVQKEPIFQYLFMKGLLKNTSFDTAVCSELPRNGVSSTSDGGKIDFIVHGKHLWGIELVVCCDINKHVSHFGPQGKYAALQADNYVVLNFSNVTDVSRDRCKTTASVSIEVTGQTRYKFVVKYGNDKPINLELQCW